MRSRALASDLQIIGLKSAMYGPDPKYKNAQDNQIFTYWQPLSLRQKDNVNHFIKYAQAISATILVIDNFQLSEDYFLKLFKNNFKWMQYVGPPSDPIYANIIVRSNPVANPQDYEKLIKRNNCKILTGPQYAALRPEFNDQKKIILNNIVKKIFINLGGGNDNGGISLLLSALIDLTNDDVELIFVSGQANPNNQKLQAALKDMHLARVQFLIDPPRIAALMANCDIAILAGGTTTFEAVSIGLPMMLIAHNQAQADQAKAWEKLGVALFCGTLGNLDKQSLQDALSKMNCFYQQQRNRGRKLSNWDNDRGARRLSKEILTLIGTSDATNHQ